MGGLTQEQFAELAGIPYKVYQHIEAGRRSNPRLSTLEKLAHGFGLTVGDLFSRDCPSPKVRQPKRTLTGQHVPASDARRTKRIKKALARKRAPAKG